MQIYGPPKMISFIILVIINRSPPTIERNSWSYSMFFHVCKILWRRKSKSSKDNWLLKKVPGRYERCISRCVTPWTFWQKSEPLDTGRNVDQKQQKKPLFWGFGRTCLFKLPLFLNELSYRYQIGLKLKLIYCIF